MSQASLTATFSTTNSFSIQDFSVVLDRDGYINFNGFEGPGQIEIYSIIGNKIIETSIQDMFQYKLMSPLELGHMYIIRVTTNGKTKTFKLVAS